MHTTWKEDQKTSEILGFGRLSEDPSDSAGGLGSGICADPPVSTASRRGAIAVDTARNGAVNRAVSVCGSHRATMRHIRRRPRARWSERSRDFWYPAQRTKKGGLGKDLSMRGDSVIFG
jgi:hypothetical protein